MELMNKVADGMLDIESSMRANMKARQFGLGIETDKIREAAMAMQYGTGTAEDLADAIHEQVGSSEEFWYSKRKTKANETLTNLVCQKKSWLRCWLSQKQCKTS
jgi:hypothetical protein